MTKKIQQKKPQKKVSSSPFKPLVALVMFVCWCLCMSSAFGVVYSTFEARNATHELEELRRETASLKVISGQYLLEQSSLASYSRVEHIAKKRLGMFDPSAEQTVLVRR